MSRDPAFHSRFDSGFRPNPSPPAARTKANLPQKSGTFAEIDGK
jgi:hypothetical protein